MDKLSLHVCKKIVNQMPSFIRAVSGWCELPQSTSLFHDKPLCLVPPQEGTTLELRWCLDALFLSFLMDLLISNMLVCVSVCACVVGDQGHCYFGTECSLGKEFYYNRALKKQLIFRCHFVRGYPWLHKGICCLAYPNNIRCAEN